MLKNVYPYSSSLLFGPWTPLFLLWTPRRSCFICVIPINITVLEIKRELSHIYLVKISDKRLNVNINNFFMKNRYFIKGTALYFSTLFSVLLNRRQRNSHVGFILSFLQYIVLFEVLEEKICHHTNV